MNDHSTHLLVWGCVSHLIADWLLQNRWMADNKANPAHPAGYVHTLVHFAFLIPVFPVYAAAIIACVHWFIDLRFALAWWRKVYQQGPMDQPVGLHIAIWGDQVAHVAVLAVAALICR